MKANPNVYYFTCLSFILLACLIFVSIAQAATWTWTGATNNNWNNTGNWSPAAIPSSAATTDLIFNTTPSGTTNVNPPGSGGGVGFTLRSMTFGSSLGNLNITGNRINFAGTTPEIINNNTAGTVTFSAVRLDANTNVTSASAANTVFGGVISQSGGARSLTINGGTVRFVAGNNSFAGGLNIINGTALVNQAASYIINATGNSYLGAGSVSATGSGRLELRATGATSDITMSRAMTLTSASATGANANLIEAPNNVTLSSTVNFNNGAELIVRSDSDNSGAGTISLSSSNFIFNSGGGILNLDGPFLNTVAAVSFTTLVNTTGSSEAIIRYNQMDAGNGWLLSGVDLDILSGNVSRGIAGTGNLRFQLIDGAALHLYQGTFNNIATTFEGVDGGSVNANSASTNAGRLSLTSGINYSFNAGIFFDKVMQVSGQFDTGFGASNNPINLNSNITVLENAQVAFQGMGRNVAGVSVFNLGSASNTLTIRQNATAVMDLGFRTDAASDFIGQLNLQANTVINAGLGTLRFTQSSTGDTYSNIYVTGDITGQGTTAAGEAFLIFDNSIGGVLSASSTSLTRQVLFDPSMDILVQGAGYNGLTVTGNKANVDGLLTGDRLRNHLLSVGSPSADQGTLTIAYNQTASRTFTNNDGPVAGSWIKLGFDQGAASVDTLYQLQATGGTGGSSLGNYNGLVVKKGFTGGSNTVQLLSNVTFNGAGGTTQTSFALLGGTFQTNNGALGYTAVLGTADLQSGTILDSSAGHNVGLLSIQGTATKTTAGVVVLSGRIVANTASATGIGLDLQAGTLSQTYSNLIGDTTNMRLGGGNWQTNGNSEVLGTLTLAADSTLNFAGGNSIIQFANSSSTSWTSGTTLYLTNWDGIPVVGGGNDRLFFGNSTSGLTAAQASQIIFVDPGGLAPGLYTGILLASGEFVPFALVVPETSSIIASISLICAAFAFEINRRRRKSD